MSGADRHPDMPENRQTAMCRLGGDNPPGLPVTSKEQTRDADPEDPAVQGRRPDACRPADGFRSSLPGCPSVPGRSGVCRSRPAEEAGGMSGGFQGVLDHIRAVASTEADKGRRFERLVKRFLEIDPVYRQRFSRVWLWREWVEAREDFAGGDDGVDLVAEEREGGFCAIQCKCHLPTTRLSRRELDSFLAASGRAPFTARLFVDTGGDWGPNAARTVRHARPAC